MAYLELKDIKKSYEVDNQHFQVLNGINLQFSKGEFVSILGESGGGKTTLMNIIAGLDGNYQGDVLLNGKSLKRETSQQLDEYRRSTIGFIFQSFNLVSHLTVKENVIVALEMTTMNKQEQEQRARDLLKQVGLADHQNKYPNQLSGGQKQRVSIARALAADPEIIIADEPTGALDAQNTDEILKLMNDIAKSGKLVIAVTHSQIVADYGTRIVHLANGVIDSDRQLKDPFPVVQENNSFHSKVASSFAMFRMAWEHFCYNLKRNILIMIGSAIGIFSVIIMLGLGNGAKGYINHEIYSQINPNTIQVTKKTGDDQTKQIKLTNQDQKKLEKIKHVKSVSKGYFAVTGGQLRQGNKNIHLQTIQTYDHTIKTKNIKTGKIPGKNEILISKGDAQKINKKNPYAVKGNKLMLYINAGGSQTQPKILQQEVTISGVSDSLSGTPAVISYDTLASMYRAGGVDFSPNFLSVDIAGGVKNVEPVQNKIKALHSSTGKADFQITGAGSIVSTLNTYVNIAVGVLTSIAAISLLVSTIMIIVVLYISVSERTQEIGILRALGFTKRNIRHLFIFEATILGFFASIIAVILAYVLELGINHLTNSGIHYSLMQISVGNVLFGVIVSVVICLLAALAPALKAARVDPVVSLSAE
ncbi:ABC transporter ATP-binding protein/permease [Fructilactobacillus florum]|uniref:ABC transporter ATP-binding protein/permease n=1 Tax=Fructilactobacillus florum TaxID=640331 RepID=UPI00028CCE27|nr:ABC transporter ATP-binding protein/permease [Fructilactobacillus florum]EKK20037.1 ABC transporter, ATP-binding protein [Fructilactobacillus florum 2F]